jgi:hypothetical protein
MSDPSQYGGGPPPIAEEEEAEFLGPGTSRLGGGYRAQVPSTRTGHFDPTTMGESGDVAPYSRTITNEVAPRYKLGDEWSPQTQSWPTERIVDLQAQLVDAGLLDPDDYQRGFWDQESATAYRQLLGYSNVSGLDSHSTLQRIGEVKAKYGSTADKGAKRQPFISELADPVELSSLLDDVAVRRMGRGLTPEEKARFSDSFRGLQETEQRKYYEASGSGLPGGPGGSVTMPDASSRAEQFVTETRPDDVSSYQYLQAFKSFENLLSRTRR